MKEQCSHEEVVKQALMFEKFKRKKGSLFINMKNS